MKHVLRSMNELSEAEVCAAGARPTARVWMVSAVAPALVLAGMTGIAGAQAATAGTIPDAQVEANVLKALASAPELATQSISTKTVYGVVTLSGSVQDENSRTHAENLAANAAGVKKVVDEMQIGAAGASPEGASGQGAAASSAPADGQVLLSDGTYGPDPSASNSSAASGSAASAASSAGAPYGQPQRNDPENDQALDQQMDQQQGGAASGNGQQAQGQQPLAGQAAEPGAPSQPAAPARPNYPVQPNYPAAGAQTAGNYPAQGYPSYPQGSPQRGAQSGNYPQRPAPWGGQQGGQAIVIPQGSMVRVQVDRLLASDRVKAGDSFYGYIANDVVAAGFVAIPRGAQVQGTVVDAHPSGAIKGRGELSIELKSVTLGGRVYPLVSDVWAHNGTDKTIQTINSAAGFGVAGALIGALAGRGAGAAIGAGVGAAAGVGASAASGRGQVVIPPEGMLTFHLVQSLPVTTVSEQEIQRLAYGVPGGQRQPVPQRPAYARYPAPYYNYPPPY